MTIFVLTGLTDLLELVYNKSSNMSELTKEYLDQKLENVATKQDLGRFDEVEKKLDVRDEVNLLKSQMKQVWDALNISHKQ